MFASIESLTSSDIRFRGKINEQQNAQNSQSGPSNIHSGDASSAVSTSI